MKKVFLVLALLCLGLCTMVHAASWDAVADFQPNDNYNNGPPVIPTVGINGVWSYGWSTTVPGFTTGSFKPYDSWLPQAHQYYYDSATNDPPFNQCPDIGQHNEGGGTSNLISNGLNQPALPPDDLHPDGVPAYNTWQILRWTAPSAMPVSFTGKTWMATWGSADRITDFWIALNGPITGTIIVSGLNDTLHRGEANANLFSGALAVNAGDTLDFVTTGTAGHDPYGYDYMRWTVTQVPEPGSILALGSGLLGLAGFAIRRRR